MLLRIRNLRPNYIGLFIAPEVQYGQLNTKFTLLGGGSVMLLLNKKWGLGVSAYHSLDESFSTMNVTPLYLTASYMGARVEYTLNPNAAVHLTFPLMIGIGRASTDSLSDELMFGDNDNDDHHGFDRFGNHDHAFIVKPGIQVEANIIRYLKIFAGANYRVSFIENNATFPKNTFSGLSLNLGFKLGLFDYWVGKSHSEE
jgi:hypothetical protein